jgi:hypothetical protein
MMPIKESASIEQNEMTTTTAPTVVLNQAVETFLREHHGEAAFAKICAIAHECYPHMVSLDFHLQEDPDMEDLTRCILTITLPSRDSEEAHLARWERYHECLVEVFPFEERILFATTVQALSDFR